MNFSIVGTGNMAWFLAKELTGAGHRFAGIYGRNAALIKGFADQYNCTAYKGLSAIPDEDDHCCFLAIRDTAIGEVAAQLSFQKSILIHTAGASSIDLLTAAAKNCAVFWPVYSITKNATALRSNIPIAIQGNTPEIHDIVFRLAQSISDQAFDASESQRLQLHLAAVFANNFSNHLIAIAEDICTEQNISFNHLQPILAQTFERLKTLPAKTTQTGPAIRNDEPTMKRHLGLLKEHPQWTALYESLSMSIRKMYERDEQ